MDRFEEQLVVSGGRLGEIEAITIGRGAVFQIVERSFWLVAGVAVAWFFSKGIK
jgi:hypothetical protein